MDYKKLNEKLISKINLNSNLQQKFLNLSGGRTIEEYLKEYSYVEDMAINVMNDLNIKIKDIEGSHKKKIKKGI